MALMNCTGAEHLGPMIERKADGRGLSICRRCRAFIYTFRASGNSYEHTRDHIADSVARDGSYPIQASILAHTFYPRDITKSDRAAFDKQVRAWCIENLIRVSERGALIVFERDGVALRRLLDRHPASAADRSVSQA